MKYPTLQGALATLLASIVVIVMSPDTADARVGESKEAFERRLFGSGGIIYRDEAVESSRRKGMPYNKYLDFMTSSTDVRIYYKTADGRRPMASELEDKRVQPGWDVHVLYVGGKSVLEVYKRSQSMSEYEMNYLIALQGGGSGWKKVEKEELEPSAFGYEMVSSDGSVRAKKMGGDSLLFVDAKIDIGLAELKTNDLLERAPVSVNGF
ncbi:MAG: hypothetical protein NWT02_03725 [Opitutales bacterium]|jgi:hypothetical protein|nr:hypothetical protein [Opitutales bacterium]MDP4643932.1 hypothetical protein [Opitutales bacterium]MDP4777602.1 hypothetical protein [Opitutales bacterium]MDP4878912.1 hypothetical protein [Opitutales bacterium]MDP4883109.1 hypothetical protein [Opitutales bacterium]